MKPVDEAGSSSAASRSDAGLVDPSNAQRPGHRPSKGPALTAAKPKPVDDVREKAETAKKVQQHMLLQKMQQAGSGNGSDSTLDFTGALDFCSPHFDPLKALSTESLKPPVPVRPLDNLSKTRDLLPPDHEDYRSQVRIGNKPIAPKPIMTGGSAAREARPKGSAAHQLLQEIAENAAEGPLQMLMVCLKSRSRVRVRKLFDVLPRVVSAV
jgi:hypothetical protein